MTNYKAQVIHDPQRGWRRFDRVSIGVSMNNPNTDGEKFRALIDFVNEQRNFKSCLICISDTLSAWNEVDENGLTLPDARERSRQRGDNWLKHNIESIRQLNIPWEIVRWDRWRKHPLFEQSLHEIEALYDNCTTFQATVNGDIDDIMRRRSKDPLVPAIAENLASNSFHFFMEEIAGYKLFYQAYPATAKIYPGSPLPSLHSEEAPIELRQEYFMHTTIRRVKNRLQLESRSSIDSSQLSAASPS